MFQNEKYINFNPWVSATTKTTCLSFTQLRFGHKPQLAFNYPLLHFTIYLTMNFVKHLYLDFTSSPLFQSKSGPARRKRRKGKLYYFVAFFASRWWWSTTNEPFIALCLKIKQIIKLFHSRYISLVVIVIKWWIVKVFYYIVSTTRRRRQKSIKFIWTFLIFGFYLFWIKSEFYCRLH